MRVQNNNAQPNFGMKVKVDRDLATVIVKEGWQQEASKTIASVKKRFVADKSEVSLSVLASDDCNGFVRSGDYFRQRHIGDVVELKRALVGAVADKKAIASLPQHVKNLNEKLGIDIKFNPVGALKASRNPRDFFAQLTKIAKDLAQIPNKEKYSVSIGAPCYGSGSFAVNIARGNGKKRKLKSFEFNPTLPPVQDNLVKVVINQLESSIKYDREQAKKAAQKKKFDASVDAFMESINGNK